MRPHWHFRVWCLWRPLLSLQWGLFGPDALDSVTVRTENLKTSAVGVIFPVAPIIPGKIAHIRHFILCLFKTICRPHEGGRHSMLSPLAHSLRLMRRLHPAIFHSVCMDNRNISGQSFSCTSRKYLNYLFHCTDLPEFSPTGHPPDQLEPWGVSAALLLQSCGLVPVRYLSILCNFDLQKEQ